MSDIIARPITVRNRCQDIAKADVPEADEGKFSAMLGHLGAALRQDGNKPEDVSMNRRLVQAFIFGDENKPFEPMSSKSFTPGQKVAMMKWVGSTFDETSQKWVTRSTFKAEANWIQNIALYFYASTLQHQDGDFYTPTLGRLLEMYLGKDTGEEFLAADYWLKLALELPGAIMAKIYEHEPESKKETAKVEEPAVGAAFSNFEKAVKEIPEQVRRDLQEFEY